MTLSMSPVDPDLRDLVNAVTVHQCDADGDAALWRQLKELGLSDLTGGKLRHGSQASWWEAAELVRALAGRGCALPVGDSDLVAGWVLDTVGTNAGQALRCCWWDDGEGPILVPHPTVERVLVFRSGESSVEFADATMGQFAERTQAGSWGSSAVVWTAVNETLESLASARLSLVRVIQVSAAMEAARDLAVEHATSREQFGRPLAKFQAVQALLADIAAETALARSVTEAAIDAMVRTGEDIDFVLPPIAAAQSCVGHAAATVARAAHQVLGAIGTTQEHELHRHTTAMLRWRAEAGDTRNADRLVLKFALSGAPISELVFTNHPIESEENHE